MPRLIGPQAPRPRRKHRYNLRLIKATWPYTVQEIAELFGVHKNAVLRWLKAGLKSDQSQRPFLIRGDELTRFLQGRQNGKRRPCADDEFYCFRCRVPRAAYLDIVDIVIETPTRLRLRGLCACCETPVNKVQSVRELANIKVRFQVQQLADEHLIERADASLNCDLEG